MEEKPGTMDFLTIGEVLVDFCQNGIGSHGYPQYEAMPGGAVANVATALAKWGLRSGIISQVGEDALGAMLAGTLASAGVDCSRVFTSLNPTSLALVSLAGDGDRSFAFYWQETSCSSLDKKLAAPELCTGSRIFHFGSVSLSTRASRETTLSAVRSAKEHGSIISFDANVRPSLWGGNPSRASIFEAIKLADIVKLSGEELSFLMGPHDAAGDLHRDDPIVAQWISKLRAETNIMLLFVTFGQEGCRWQSATGTGFLQAPQVQPVDTTGAGDCFTAGILYRFLKLNRKLDELSDTDCLAMARQGVVAGSLSTEQRGGIPSIPGLEQMAEKMRDEFTEGPVRTS